MSYLKDFQTQIANHDYPALLRLWEEYCASDEVDPDEYKQILASIKASDMAEAFGRHVDRGIPLWKTLPQSKDSHEVIKLIIDLQTTNTPQFAEIALDYLKQQYGSDKDFVEKMRLIGMRNKEKFQGAISNFELLTHMLKGNFVFHTGGWGIGEILDVSLIREQLSLEFDYAPGVKEMSFETAFRMLIPVPENHFLALRFGKPDTLEQMAKEKPLEVIHMLLRDLGDKTAAEIKDELADLVIPAAEWQKWWQNARSKIKKDTMIESPEDLGSPFRLRRAEVSHEERLQKALENKPDASTLIQMVYSFIKDFPETLKNAEFKAQLLSKMKEMLSFPEITSAQELQIHFFLQDLGGEKEYAPVAELIKRIKNFEELFSQIDLQTFKKRALAEIRKNRADWKEIFTSLFFLVEYSPLRDYILSELLGAGAKPEVLKALQDLYTYPARHPEAFLWYFQKVIVQPELPFGDQEGKNQFFESFLVLLSQLEHKEQGRELIKKMHALLSGGRFAIVRQIMQGASQETCKEFLLLATKCHSLSDHDIKILHSLAEVVHPTLAKGRRKSEAPSTEGQTLWTTQDGYEKLQKRIQQIATVETVQNAKEIEIARAHGDLRENAEFKAALEKRDRLQSELKLLSDQMNHTRVLTVQDISVDEVGVGTVIECTTKKGKVTYTLLGPWDADPERNILSFQSKLAQAMAGLTVGKKFEFQGEEYTIASIKSFLK
ncbi:MAG: GreA/GreB family elongation factor [Chlamydiales bacterium]|nr:GreA/GreB family elongation factor [Chlamydiales bacterium]